VSVPEKKVKLSIAGNVESLRTLWINDCLLCTTSSENMIRCWDLQQDENYALTLYDQQVFNDKIVCASYEPKGRLLVGGTQEGKIIVWKNKNNQFDDKDHWKIITSPMSEPGEVTNIAVGKGVIGVQYEKRVFIVVETDIKALNNQHVQATLLSSKKIRVSTFDNNNYIVRFLFSTKM
jgi:intraflagellar transport protein 140